MARLRGTILVLVLTSVGGVRAEAPAAEQRIPSAVPLEVILVGAAGDGDELPLVLGSWLGERTGRVRIGRQGTLRASDVLRAAPQSGTLRIWVVLTSQRRAQLYFANPSGTRHLVREVPLRNGLDELGREQLAQVLVGTVQAFEERRLNSSAAEVNDAFLNPVPESDGRESDGRESDGRESDGRESDGKVPPHAGDGRSVSAAGGPRFAAGLSYSVVARGGEGTGQGPGGYLSVSGKVLGQVASLILRGQHQFPAEERSERIALSAQATGARLVGGLGVPLSSLMAVRGELGGGVDYVTFTPRALREGEVATRGKGHDVRPMLLIGGRLAYARDWWELAVVTTLNIPLTRAHYDLMLNGAQRVELSAWSVQPGVSVEVGWQ